MDRLAEITYSNIYLDIFWDTIFYSMLKASSFVDNRLTGTLHQQCLLCPGNNDSAPGPVHLGGRVKN